MSISSGLLADLLAEVHRGSNLAPLEELQRGSLQDSADSDKHLNITQNCTFLDGHDQYDR